MQLPRGYGDYALEERLAAGEVCDVFVARWAGPPSDRPPRVALKVTHEDAGEAAHALLIAEAKLAERLSHPHIVRTLDHGLADGCAYQAMELCAGPTLAQVLADGTALGHAPRPEHALELARQLCDALAYAHGLDKPALHLRINPRNVLIDPAGRALLCDFSTPRGSDATLPGQAVGPPEDAGYLAPEQVTGQPVSGRADQFAVAAMLWEMLCARALFQDEREAERAHVLQPSRVGSGVPPLVDDTVLRALERDERKRFEDVAAFGTALAETLDVLDPDGSARDLGTWLGPILLGEPTLQDRTNPSPNLAATIEVDPDVGTVEVKSEELTLPGPASEEPVEESDEPTATVPVPRPAEADDEAETTARVAPSPSSAANDDDDETARVAVSPSADDGDGDAFDDGDPLDKTMPVVLSQTPDAEPTPEPDARREPARVTHIVTEAPAASPASGPNAWAIGGGALVIGLLGGGLIVWALRGAESPPPARDPPPAVEAAPVASGDDGDDDDGRPAPPTPSAETPSGRCGKAPFGDGYERAKKVVQQARVSLLQRDFVEAKRLLAESLDIAATSAAHYELGRLAVQAGDTERARRSLGCALVLAPESEEAQRAAVELAQLDRPGDTPAARPRDGVQPAAARATRKRKASDLSRPVALAKLKSCASPCARLLVDALSRREGEQLDDNLAFAVEECLDQCKTLASRRVGKELSRTAARAALRGDLDAAEEAALRGLKLSPDDVALHRLLGTVYRRQGKKARARKHFRRYLALSPGAADAPTIKDYLKDMD